MRRALFVAIVALLVADASGLTSLLAPEACAVEATDSSPDGGCPAFCVRCSCACCVSSIEHAVFVDVTASDLVPQFLPSSPFTAVLSGAPWEIRHVPKPLLS